MRLKPLHIRTDDEQFSRYIRTEYNKEMAMAHSSYARAAGIQSEISKVTVTRVASSEVECKRQTNVYKKDMIITINNISREQRMLRKAMVRYSKKKKEHRMIKEKREKLLLEKQQKEREHLEQWEQIQALLNLKNGVSNEIMDENKVGDGNDVKLQTDEEIDDDHQPHSDENNNETTKIKHKRTKRKSNIQSDSEEIGLSLNPFEVLPAITEAENEHEVIAENDHETKTTEDMLSTSETKQSTDDSSSSLSPLFALSIRPLKPKKHVVSFSDIIKLKHSHNTKELFDMVHVLAQKHGVNESVEKRRAEKRNSRIPRGSTDAVISESLRKAASVIYPMKFGYGDHESNNKETFDFYDATDGPETTIVSTESATSDKGDKISVRGTHSSMKMKRYKSTSGINEDMKKLRKEEMIKNGLAEEGRRFTHISSRSTSSKRLPAIGSAKSSPNHSRSNSVSWTEAFGLLKIVHSID